MTMGPTDIDDILVRSLQGRASDGEERVLARWRSAAPENEAHYRLLADAWRMTDSDDVPFGDGPPPLSRVLAAARAERGMARRRLVRGVAAAVIVLAFLGGGHAAYQWGGAPDPGSESQSHVVATGAGERATLTLSDGTVVRLGERSSLRVTPVGRDMEARLEGRAFFGVHPDSTRTFSVHTAHGVATVLGTRFEMRTEGRRLEVAVVQGEVQVGSGGPARRVREGQMSRSEAGPMPPTVEAIDDEALLDRLAWMGPVLVFRRTPLDRAIAEIAHRYGVDVRLEDETLARVPVTGLLSDLPVGEALQVICEIVQASCSRAGEGFTIGGADRPDPPAGG